jgi:hypothetical protein
VMTSAFLLVRSALGCWWPFRLNDSRRPVRVIGPRSVDNGLADDRQTTNRARGIREIVEALPGCSTIPGRPQPLIARQRTNPAFSRVRESSAPEVCLLNSQLFIPMGAAGRCFQYLSVAVDRPSRIRVEEEDIVGPRARYGSICFAPLILSSHRSKPCNRPTSTGSTGSAGRHSRKVRPVAFAGSSTHRIPSWRLRGCPRGLT